MWLPPAAIRLTPLRSPDTSTGMALSVLVPSPSCPDSLEPQHATPPLLITAHECREPVAIAIAAKDAVSGVAVRGGVAPCVGDWVSKGDVWPGVGLAADEQAVMSMPIARAFANDDMDAGISATSSDCR
ncbi:MAG TPA: hypothetical protein VFV53_03295 [Candidatus Limnocylindrales bacterium]|nr:hypothetical protein [Candidatus Limnocylindrales bacterium]